MKTRNRLYPVVALGCIAVLAGSVLAQNDKPTPAPQPAPAKDTPAKPSPKPVPTDKTQPAIKDKAPAKDAAGSTDVDFRKLAALVGEWNASTKLKMSADMEPIYSRARTRNTLILDNKYLQSETTGEMEGRSTHTIEIFAYNAGARRFDLSWMDSRTTGITQLRGVHDSASDAIVFTGDIEDPATGKVVGNKATMRLVDAKTYVIEVFAKGQDGAEFVRMETTYRRAGEKTDAKTPEPAKPTPAAATTDKPPAKK